MTKRLAWRNAKVPVKNAFELKSARRVGVEGNIFENVWTSGQDGTAIVFESTNQDGRPAVRDRARHLRRQHRPPRGKWINTEVGKAGADAPERANHIRGPSNRGLMNRMPFCRPVLYLPTHIYGEDS
jgi:hypothetical protein